MFTHLLYGRKYDLSKEADRQELSWLMRQGWTVAFALIPLLNIFYLLIGCMAAGGGRRFYLWAVPAALIPCVALAYYLPQYLEPVWWYFFITALALIQHFVIRGTEYHSENITLARLLLLAVTAALAVGAFTAVHRVTEGNLAAERAEAVMSAAVSQDNLAWFELLHPDCDEEISSIRQLYRMLHGSDVYLTGPLEQVKVLSNERMGPQGSAVYRIAAEVTAGGVTYFVDLRFLNDRQGFGLRSLAMWER